MLGILLTAALSSIACTGSTHSAGFFSLAIWARSPEIMIMIISSFRMSKGLYL